MNANYMYVYYNYVRYYWNTYYTKAYWFLHPSATQPYGKLNHFLLSESWPGHGREIKVEDSWHVYRWSFIDTIPDLQFPRLFAVDFFQQMLILIEWNGRYSYMLSGSEPDRAIGTHCRYLKPMRAVPACLVLRSVCFATFRPTFARRPPGR